MADNFFQIYTEMAEKNPEKVLLRIDDNELTYGTFMQKTAVLASAMKKYGIGVN